MELSLWQWISVLLRRSIRAPVWPVNLLSTTSAYNLTQKIDVICYIIPWLLLLLSILDYVAWAMFSNLLYYVSADMYLGWRVVLDYQKMRESCRWCRENWYFSCENKGFSQKCKLVRPWKGTSWMRGKQDKLNPGCLNAP